MTSEGRRRVLFIAPYYACNKRTGGGQRTRLIFSALTSVFDVDVVVVGSYLPGASAVTFAEAGRVCLAKCIAPNEMRPFSIVRPLHPKLVSKAATALVHKARLYAADDQMRQSLGDIDFNFYDLIVGRYLQPTAQTGVLDMPVSAPVIIDIDDRDDQIIESRLEAVEQSPWVKSLLNRHLKAVQRVMATLLPRASHLWTASKADADVLEQSSVSVLPNIPFFMPSDDVVKSNTTEVNSEKTILFVGSAGHAPNAEGIANFILHCWPAITVNHPTAQLHIVGSGEWDRSLPMVARLPGVEVVGAVDDLAPEYKRALFCISPVERGAGTKIKVLEALAFGRGIVTAPNSAYGLPPEMLDGPVRVASDRAQMIELCNGLLSSPERALAYAWEGRKIIEDKFNRDQFTRIVTEDCERTIGEHNSKANIAASLT
ncbi:MAG: hypothetical protein DHS20C05_12460 [Hyphococcus sp.]|nr:MAG: hypothetical protein DHS20C05_12460 [Marinicaulis sp.]